MIWSGVIGFGCWLLVELMEAATQWARDRQTRWRLGAAARPGESAYEERLRLRAAQIEEREPSGARR